MEDDPTNRDGLVEVSPWVDSAGESKPKKAKKDKREKKKKRKERKEKKAKRNAISPQPPVAPGKLIIDYNL